MDFYLSKTRGIAAAKAFFRKALTTNPKHPPRKVTRDGHVPSHRALRLLRREHPAWRRVRVRCCKYLNHIVEQVHRTIKGRCAPMLGFKSFESAAITIAGIELAHQIRKCQFALGHARGERRHSMKSAWEVALFRAA